MELTDKEFTQKLDAKLEEVDAYLNKQFAEVSKEITRQLVEFHREHCQRKDTSEAPECEKGFIDAFMHLLALRDKHLQHPALMIAVEVEEEEKHTHEPSKEDKNKDDSPGLYL